MKASLTSSVILHIVVIAMVLFSFSTPKTFNMSDSETLPVDIVPIESLTQIQQGEKKAPKTEKATPKSTFQSKNVEQAENIGNNEQDLKAPPMPEIKPKSMETVEAAKLDPKPIDEQDTTEQPKIGSKQEMNPDVMAQKIDKQEDSVVSEETKLPDKVPTPEAKLQTPQTQVTTTSGKKSFQSATKAEVKEKNASADEVAALLNREKASGGGAKRSTEQAAFGGKKTMGTKLSQSEMDALRSQIARCWNVPAGVEDTKGLRVTIKMQLTETGEIKGSPQVISGGGDAGVGRVAAESARRAVVRCAPYSLPHDKYDHWADVIVNFDPREMF